MLRQKIFTGDGNNRLFDFSFPILSTRNVEVWIDDRQQKDGFSVTKGATGGSVTFTDAPRAGAAIVLRARTMPMRRAHFRDGERLSAISLNNELESIAHVTKEIREHEANTLHLAPSDSENVDTQIPAPQADAVLVGRKSGTGWRNSIIDFDLIAAGFRRLTSKHNNQKILSLFWGQFISVLKKIITKQTAQAQAETRISSVANAAHAMAISTKEKLESAPKPSQDSDIQGLLHANNVATLARNAGDTLVTTRHLTKILNRRRFRVYQSPWRNLYANVGRYRFHHNFARHPDHVQVLLSIKPYRDESRMEELLYEKIFDLAAADSSYASNAGAVGHSIQLEFYRIVVCFGRGIPIMDSQQYNLIRSPRETEQSRPTDYIPMIRVKAWVFPDDLHPLQYFP